MRSAPRWPARPARTRRRRLMGLGSTSRHGAAAVYRRRSTTPGSSPVAAAARAAAGELDERADAYDRRERGDRDRRRSRCVAALAARGPPMSSSPLRRSRSSQAEMNPCATLDFERADAELNRSGAKRSPARAAIAADRAASMTRGRPARSTLRERAARLARLPRRRIAPSRAMTRRAAAAWSR